MLQKEFEKSKAAQIKALKTWIENPAIKVIGMVEILLEQNPGLPLTVQDGNRQLRIVSVTVDFIKGVQLHVSSPEESTPADGRDRALLEGGPLVDGAWERVSDNMMT